jgi:xanthine dehydrogenase YagR molybdenum-binding subunit
VARLIRTEKEVEGRFEEVWLVVEEDALDQWPAGPRKIVGRDAVRKDALERARGEATFTADLQLPGMLHAAILRSPHAHAHVRSLDLSPALAMPGVHAAVGPLTEEAGYHGEAVAAVAADTFAQAHAALDAIVVDWEEAEIVLDAEDAVRRELFATDPVHYERGDFERALATADVVVEGTYRTAVVLHNSMETHQSVCRWVGESI